MCIRDSSERERSQRERGLYGKIESSLDVFLIKSINATQETTERSNSIAFSNTQHTGINMSRSILHCNECIGHTTTRVIVRMKLNASLRLKDRTNSLYS